MVTYKKYDSDDQPKKVEVAEPVEKKLADPAEEKRVPPVETPKKK